MAVPRSSWSRSSFQRLLLPHHISFFFFFFTDPPTTEIYTLSLHDALPIFTLIIDFPEKLVPAGEESNASTDERMNLDRDRKSTRLNSSHPSISYAVFCLKKKKKHNTTPHTQPTTEKRYTSRTQLPNRSSNK